ncbi:unnamed protein product [Paramecium sonneborni]|uniref:Transmembrane protein n=1 Tax=Paramecium sonneborni TaxID=65129 RepID=A0A8S1L695_9CILI|nr:unnamed protein product [Paramecium sonneborni]
MCGFKIVTLKQKLNRNKIKEFDSQLLTIYKKEKKVLKRYQQWFSFSRIILQLKDVNLLFRQFFNKYQLCFCLQLNYLALFLYFIFNRYQRKTNNLNFREGQNVQINFKCINNNKKNKQQIMSQEEPLNINEQLKKAMMEKIKGILKWITEYQSYNNQYKENIKNYIENNFKNILNIINQEYEVQIQKYHEAHLVNQEQQQKMEDEVELYQLIESFARENTNIKQLIEEYQNEIKNYVLKQNQDVESLKKNINKFLEKKFQSLIKTVQTIIGKQSQALQELLNLKDKYLQEINEKQQIICELNLRSFNDQNVLQKIQQINHLLSETSQKTNQTTQKLEHNSLDQLAQQIKQIHNSITGENDKYIKEQNKKLMEAEQTIEYLQNEILELQNQLKNNEYSKFLSQKIEQLQQKQENQLNQQDQINEKTNKILEIELTLNEINKYINKEKEILRKQFEDEKNKVIQVQLEGCYKLQDKSLLYIQLGLLIFLQYYKSENSNGAIIQNLIDKLIKFHQIYQEKKNFKLKDINDIEKYYTNLERELKSLYDMSKETYNKFIREINLRRNQ